MYPPGKLGIRGSAVWSGPSSRLETLMKDLIGLTTPSLALAAAWGVAYHSPAAFDVVGPMNEAKRWSKQRAYWCAMTTLSFALDELDAFLVRNFDGPENQHPAAYKTIIAEERTAAIHRILAGNDRGPVLLGNKTVLVRLTLSDPPALDIGRTCPLPIGRRVEYIVLHAAPVIDNLMRKTA